MTKEAAVYSVILVCGLLVTVLGMTVMAGWLLHMPKLFQLSANMVPMQFNTALTHFLCGIALLTARGSLRPVSMFCAGIAGIFAFCIGLQYIVDGDFGIDHLFVEPYVASRTAHPGRMAPNTVVCFLMMSCAFMSWHYIKNVITRLNALTFFGAIVFLMSFIALAGYIVKVEAAYSWWGLSDMAPQTAVSFLIMSVGVLALISPQWHLEKRRSWMPVFIAIFGITLTLLVTQGIIATGQKRAEELTTNEAMRKAYMIDNELRNISYLTKRMRDRWEASPSPLGGWTIDALNHLSQYPVYHAFALLNAEAEVYESRSLKDDDRFWEGVAINKETLKEAWRQDKNIVLSQGPVVGAWPLMIVFTPLKNDKMPGFVAVAYSLEIKIDQLKSMLISPDLKLDVYDGDKLIFSNDPQRRASIWEVKSEATTTFEDTGLTVRTSINVAHYQNNGLALLVLLSGMVLSMVLANTIRQKGAIEAARLLLREREGLLNLFVRHVPVAVAMLDKDLRYLACSDSWYEYTGVSEKLEGKPYDTIYKTIVNPNPLWTGHAARALAGEVIVVEKDGYRLPHGDMFYVRYQMRQWHDTDGKVGGVIIFGEKITERVLAEEELRHTLDDLTRSNKELEQFAHVASHDLKAPLRGIDNLAKWVIEDTGDALPADAREKLDLMRGRIARLETLLSDILKYSRAGRIVAAPENVDTGELLDGIAKMGAWENTFKVVVDKGMPVIVSPRTPLEQVFTNLVMNAIKHHDKNEGVVRISAQEKGENYEFIVADDGPGIPVEFHDRVFQMFQTLQSRDKKEGSGLGLAIVKKLVEWQGCTIWVVSNGTRGTEIHFTWPKVFKERKGKDAA